MLYKCTENTFMVKNFILLKLQFFFTIAVLLNEMKTDAYFDSQKINMQKYTINYPIRDPYL